MKKYTKLIVVALLTVTFLIINSNLSYAKKESNYINEIIQVSGGKVEECGLKVSTTINNDEAINISSEIEEKVCLQLLEEYKSYMNDKCDVTIQKSDLAYCINFEGSNISGYIESKNCDAHKVITMNLLRKTEKNELSGMKVEINQNIKKVFDDNNIEYMDNKIKYFNYVKVKLSDINISNMNDEIIRYLKKQKVKNIDTVKINNGFSTSAYTESYERISNSGGWMDFNYMINRYFSGTYLVIGTPVLDVDFEQ